MTLTRPRNKKNRISWDDHHMSLALITAQRSCDPNTQVGTCIVDTHNRVVGLGYNNPPKGINCGQIPWDRESESACDTKYPYIIHAERNAINNANKDVVGCTLYATMYPCAGCTRDIIQAGIKKVFYLTNPYENTSDNKAASRMFQLVDVEVIQFKWQKVEIISCLQKLCEVIKSLE